MIHHLPDTDGPSEQPPSQLLSLRPPGPADAAVLTRAVCPQAEDGTRAGAVATVMAAVDLARVRLPGQAEGDVATQQLEEEEDKQEELQAWQQAGETQLESPAGPGPVWVSQVGVVSVGGWDSSPVPDNMTLTRLCCLHSRLREPRHRPASLTSPSLKSLFPNPNRATR